MAGHEMTQVVHARYTAGGFDLHYAFLENPLANSRSDERFTVCLRHGNIALNLFFEPSFPHTLQGSSQKIPAPQISTYLLTVARSIKVANEAVTQLLHGLGVTT